MAISPQSVSSVTQSIKSLLESRFCQVSIEGELSNLSLQPSGHLYFGIRDHQAFLHGAFFHFRSKGKCRLPKDGDRVVIHGKLTVYAPKGQYQLVAHSLHYTGEGDLLQQLEALKRRLTNEGYFNQERKRPLPTAPRTIGVISSPAGAVIQDILRILSRRCHQFRVLLYPTTVQGSSAATEISQAIAAFNEEKLADVLIIARGGGSFEDLHPFNDERLVKAIASSTIPIISAVGHETDYTLCDFAADLRAPTPSVAAELVCKSSEYYLQQLNTVLTALKRHAHLLLLKKREALQYWKRFFLRTDFYRPAQQSLDYLNLALQRAMQTKLRLYQQRYEQLSHYILSANAISAIHKYLATLRQKLNMQILHQLRRENERLRALRECLSSLNPKKILQRGYAMLFDFNSGSTIISSKDLSEHRCIGAVLQDGEVSFTVTNVKVLRIEGH